MRGMSGPEIDEFSPLSFLLLFGVVDSLLAITFESFVWLLKP